MARHSVSHVRCHSHRYRHPLRVQSARQQSDRFLTANPGALGRRHYHVYEIGLSPDVLNETKFRKCNPGYIAGNCA
jgi:hypothetical protein